MDREEQEETDFRLLSKRRGGVQCCGLRADVPNWQRKEKKTKRDWWFPSLTPISVNLQSVCAEHQGGSHHQAASQSFESLFSEPLLLWPVGRVSNKAESEKAERPTGSGDFSPYMWTTLQFAAKMRRDKEQKHFLAIRAESGDEPVRHTVSSRYRGQRCRC